MTEWKAKYLSASKPCDESISDLKRIQCAWDDSDADRFLVRDWYDRGAPTIVLKNRAEADAMYRILLKTFQNGQQNVRDAMRKVLDLKPSS